MRYDVWCVALAASHGGCISACHLFWSREFLAERRRGKTLGGHIETQETAAVVESLGGLHIIRSRSWIGCSRVQGGSDRTSDRAFRLPIVIAIPGLVYRR
jgi:hypothetical protein